MATPEQITAIARQVKGVIFDVDGVLTDGSITYSDDGWELKTFHVGDGASLKLLNSHLPVAIVTGRKSVIVTRRADELGITHLIQGADNKSAALTELIEAGFPPDCLAAVGDDLADLKLFDDPRVILNMTVPDAHPAVLDRAHVVTKRRGGSGVAIEVTQLLLTALDRWPY